MENIISFLDAVFGVTAAEIKTEHMLARSLVVYIVGIALVRIGNKRFVGKMTAFDIIITIVIGSLLSRAITNVDLFLKVLPACLFLILLHRLFSRIAAKSSSFGDLIKGKERIVAKDGVIIARALYKSNLSEQDLIQALRLQARVNDVKKIRIARLERNGEISFILKDDNED